MSVSIGNLTVSFSGFKALDSVNVEFKSGRIHALVGANGSGKSTLVKVITGVYTPAAGTSIIIDGKAFPETNTPNNAKKLGVRVVHQEAPLINTLTVSECFALFKGYPCGPLWKIKWSKLNEYVRGILERLDIPIKPNTLVRDLSASERSMVALAITIGDEKDISNTKFLLLDEADASIPEDEAEKYLKRVQKIADLGIPVLMVTHRLKDVAMLANDITILAGGKVSYSGPSSNINEDFIIEKMLDNNSKMDAALAYEQTSTKSLWEVTGRSEFHNNETVLKVEKLSSQKLNDVSFSIKKGEIVGIVGNADSGINELPQILSGARNKKSGEILINDRQLSSKMTPKKAINSGIMLVPSDRLNQGGIGSLTARENVSLPDAMTYWHRKDKENKVVKKVFDVFDVRPLELEKLFGTFSGGNQQKIIIGKWLLLRPSIFILDDPTNGVDPGARRKIFGAVKDASSEGVGVVIFSTEPQQLALLCDRVLVLKNGNIINELKRSDNTLTIESIAKWCFV
ncbi:MAG: ATP-binding cassette domain-containing protein [Ruminiclostridium sp.]